jgi:hypothetical protein
VPPSLLALLPTVSARSTALPSLLFGTANAEPGSHAEDAAAYGVELAGEDALPVFAATNNDVVVLLVRGPGGRKRFVRYGLEEGLMDDYGAPTSAGCSRTS